MCSRVQVDRSTGIAPFLEIHKSCCPNLQRFSYQSTSTEAPNSLCMNVPLVCSLCPSSASAMWKYNLCVHFAKQHLAALFTDHFSNFGISASEKEALQQKWRNHYKKESWGCQKTVLLHWLSSRSTVLVGHLGICEFYYH